MFKDLLICLMVNLKNFGKITTANFSEETDFINVDFEDEKYFYSVSVNRKTKPSEKSAKEETTDVQM